MSRRWLGPVVIVAMVLFALVVYRRLPADIPTHWGVGGEVNGTTPKLPGVLLFPGMAFLLWLALPALRQVDPRREHYEQFDETFWIVVNLVVCVLAVLEVLALGSALGWPVDMSRAVPALMGLLLIAFGNYLPRLRSNWWMGIRTPWTLSSERVWRATHRFGGWSFVLGGLSTSLAALLSMPLRIWVIIPAILLAALSPAVYSYVAWRREVASHS